MRTVSKKETLIDLETRFWQSMVDQDSDVAVSLLNEPALMVSQHGSIKFDHAGYRKMAEQGKMVITSFELKDVDVVFPNETTAILSYRVTQRVENREKSASKGPATQDMADTSTWVKAADGWRCVMHTETPVQ